MHDILKRKYFWKDLKGENEAKKTLQKLTSQWKLLSSGKRLNNDGAASVFEMLTSLTFAFQFSARAHLTHISNPKDTRKLSNLKSPKIPQGYWKLKQHTLPYPKGFLCYYRLHLRMALWYSIHLFIGRELKERFYFLNASFQFMNLPLSRINSSKWPFFGL